MLSGFCLDIEKVAVPVTNNICNFEDHMRKHINDFTMRVDSRNNILS